MNIIFLPFDRQILSRATEYCLPHTKRGMVKVLYPTDDAVDAAESLLHGETILKESRLWFSGKPGTVCRHYKVLCEMIHEHKDVDVLVLILHPLLMNFPWYFTVYELKTNIHAGQNPEMVLVDTCAKEGWRIDLIAAAAS